MIKLTEIKIKMNAEQLAESEPTDEKPSEIVKQGLWPRLAAVLKGTNNAAKATSGQPELCESINANFYFVRDEELGVFLRPPSMSGQAAISLLERGGYKLRHRSMHDQEICFRRGSEEVRLIEEGGVAHKNFRYSKEHDFDSRKINYGLFKPWSSLLKRIGKEKSTNARVLYVGSGGDASVEKIFPNTVHLDPQNPGAFGKIRGGKVQGNILESPFKDDSFDIIIFRNIPSGLFEEEKLFPQLSRLLKEDGIIVDSVKKYIAAGGIKNYTLSRMHLAQDQFASNGFETQEIEGGLSDFERVYKKKS